MLVIRGDSWKQSSSSLDWASSKVLNTPISYEVPWVSSRFRAYWGDSPPMFSFEGHAFTIKRVLDGDALRTAEVNLIIGLMIKR